MTRMSGDRQSGLMQDSERYLDQAELVCRLADKAENPEERRVYLDIAESWRKLAEEARRHEAPYEERSFDPRRR